jgi:hypothetical protein
MGGLFHFLPPPLHSGSLPQCPESPRGLMEWMTRHALRLKRGGEGGAGMPYF